MVSLAPCGGDWRRRRGGSWAPVGLQACPSDETGRGPAGHSGGRQGGGTLAQAKVSGGRASGTRPGFGASMAQAPRARALKPLKHVRQRLAPAAGLGQIVQLAWPQRALAKAKAHP